MNGFHDRINRKPDRINARQYKIHGGQDRNIKVKVACTVEVEMKISDERITGM